MSWSGSSGEKAVSDTGRDDDPLVLTELARLDQGRRAGPPEERPNVDESDLSPTLGDDPQIRLSAMEMQTAEDALGRGREIGLDEPLAAGKPRRRHSSRNEPRSSA